ncbi:MAG: alpha/beta hydrolase [Saprospiraceae bacterium]|nr:alpha/beta hydrolase [Saprospiraceae bacterium]
MTDYPITEEGGFRYIELGPGTETPLVLLHGLFGTASNFDAVMDYFSGRRKVLLPLLPIFEMPLRKLSVMGLVQYVRSFLEFKSLDKIDVLGNSLGGHLALLYTLEHKDKVRSMILSGSSGLYESAFGTTFPRREDYEYIRKKVQLTFYDPKVTTKSMVDEIFQVVNNRAKAIRIVKTAKSAIYHNVADQLHRIKVPTLLVWGLQDAITPIFVGEKFKELIPESTLETIDKCGHAPMLERPEKFNKILEDFLQSLEDGT